MKNIAYKLDERKLKNMVIAGKRNIQVVEKTLKIKDNKKIVENDIEAGL